MKRKIYAVLLLVSMFATVVSGALAAPGDTVLFKKSSMHSEAEKKGSGLWW